MFGSAILEAVIGTVTVYILLSLICVVLNEWISRLGSLRQGLLRREITALLGKDLSQRLFSQQLISGLIDGDHYPSYIPTSTFAIALIDIGYQYTPGSAGAPGTTSVKAEWAKGTKSHQLLEGLRLSATSYGPLQTRIEKWFDLSMEHVSGKYKRTTQNWILAVSAGIVGAGNVDTLAIIGHLYDGAMAHTATKFALFWSSGDAFGFEKFAGLALTWGAVSLGAPFWFDMLGKLVNLRQTGLPPDENKRQTGVPGVTLHGQ